MQSMGNENAGNEITCSSNEEMDFTLACISK